VVDWKELFDVIVVGCRKPSFFLQSRPFRKVDLPTGRLNWQRVTELKPGHVYSQGSLDMLNKMVGWKGDEVLYFGDHVIADLKESSSMGAWKTAVIIRELEKEIEQQNTPRFRRDLRKLLALEEELAEHNPSSELMDPQARTNLYHRRNRLRTALKTRFNPYFGSVFRTHKEPTMFANLMNQFAYMYTSRLENLDTLPLDYWLHAKRTYLPHEDKMSVVAESAGEEDRRSHQQS
jgi:5' nucleotidase family